MNITAITVSQRGSDVLMKMGSQSWSEGTNETLLYTPETLAEVSKRLIR